jgi:hypothetical protein
LSISHPAAVKVSLPNILLGHKFSWPISSQLYVNNLSLVMLLILSHPAAVDVSLLNILLWRIPSHLYLQSLVTRHVVTLSHPAAVEVSLPNLDVEHPARAQVQLAHLVTPACYITH